MCVEGGFHFRRNSSIHRRTTVREDTFGCGSGDGDSTFLYTSAAAVRFRYRSRFSALVFVSLSGTASVVLVFGYFLFSFFFCLPKNYFIFSLSFSLKNTRTHQPSSGQCVGSTDLRKLIIRRQSNDGGSDFNASSSDDCQIFEHHGRPTREIGGRQGRVLI